MPQIYQEKTTDQGLHLNNLNMCVVSLYYHSIPWSLSTNIAHVTFDHKYYAYPTKAVSLHASLLHASVAGLLL